MHLLYPFAKRFIAGPDLPTALKSLNALESSGFLSTVDILGEHVHQPGHVEAAKKTYLDLIEAALRKTSIPVIASINCISDSEWYDFARKIEEAGAHALELNVYFLPAGKNAGSQNYEKLYLDIAEKVKSKIDIPVVMKLGPNFTNLVNLTDLLYHRGIEGVVFFNRFYS